MAYIFWTSPPAKLSDPPVCYNISTMIPVKLKIRNFMPYKGEVPALSFAGMHTACISGDNGAGKSSIIDAITWALWGKARSGSDDELIHQGENEMEVEFDFIVNRHLYRAIRKYARPKSQRASGQGSLDLFIEHEGLLTTISGDTKTQTEQKLIHDILHMDYNTFINSAYLRQSHADEFTRQTPSKRKEVLASILNLSVYDEYEKRAKEKAREAEQERLKTGGNIDDMKTELEKKPLKQEQFEQAQTVLEELATVIKSQETSLKQLRIKQHEMNAAQSRCEQLALIISQHENDLAREQNRLEQAKAKIDHFQKLVDQQESIDAGYERFNQATSSLEALNQKARQLARFRDKKNQLEKVVDQAQARLNTDHRVLEASISQLEDRVSKLPQLVTELNQLQPRQKELAQLESFVNAQRQRMQDTRETLAKDNAEISRLKQEIKDADDKLKMLSQSSEAAVCPLCESELGTQKLELVRQKYDDDKNQKSESIARLSTGVGQSSAQVKVLEDEVTRFESRYKQENNALRDNTARLNQSIKEAQDARSQLEAEKQDICIIEERLLTKNYAQEEQRLLEQIAAGIAGLEYDETRHETAQQEAAKLKPFEQQKRLLDEALRLLPQEKENLVQAQETVLELKKRQEADLTARRELLNQLVELPELNTALKTAEDEFALLLKQQEKAQESKGSLMQTLAYLAELENKLNERLKLFNELTQRESVYEQLAQIFGKKGIQAVLIETALPEIEEEANRLLARMTDNRMHLAFKTQQLTKKGDPLETLAILIADELGTRDYDLFSGGEAFRIDFSIRIALSRLLARRAGAPLPTLIIDEGFGTQDTDGIEKLKEAINSIQGDFEKIIVITHIEELKDAFPTRINVVKTPDGSTIEVG